MSIYYVNNKPVDWRELIHSADKEGCIWKDNAIKTVSEAAKFLKEKGNEISDISPCERKLKMAVNTLEEIASMKYKLGGETEEAEIARKAIEDIDCI